MGSYCIWKHISEDVTEEGIRTITLHINIHSRHVIYTAMSRPLVVNGDLFWSVGGAGDEAKSQCHSFWGNGGRGPVGEPVVRRANEDGLWRFWQTGGRMREKKVFFFGVFSWAGERKEDVETVWELMSWICRRLSILLVSPPPPPLPPPPSLLCRRAGWSELPVWALKQE